ncbi:MAG: hypothetical protein HYS35_04545 [Betaproteobacteria bacterium]|nr:hypothetical protein [Betaproteobacteria bacterium]
MELRTYESLDRAWLGLRTIVLLLCATGIGAVIGWMALALDAPQPVSTFQAAPCRVCGVVELVRELDASTRPPEINWVEGGLGARPADYRLSSGRVDTIVLLLAALGAASGAVSNAPAAVYETAVRLEDGSVRVLRESSVPPWKPGDRVKVLRGRVEPLS